MYSGRQDLSFSPVDFRCDEADTRCLFCYVFEDDADKRLPFWRQENHWSFLINCIHPTCCATTRCRKPSTAQSTNRKTAEKLGKMSVSRECCRFLSRRCISQDDLRTNLYHFSISLLLSSPILLLFVSQAVHHRLAVADDTHLTPNTWRQRSESMFSCSKIPL